VRDYVHKGSFLFVEGKNRTRSWDDKDTNKKVYRHEVLIWELSLLDRAEQNGNGGRSRGETADRGDAYEHAGARQNDGYDALGIDDRDIPF
jgi:single-strand DNA-binding protein